MQLFYPIRGNTFYQGQIGTATKIAKVQIIPVLKPAQSFRIFNASSWLNLPFKKKPTAFEVTCNVYVDDPLRYISNCVTARVVSGETKELCTIYIFPIFSSASTESYDCSFTLNFEVVETSISSYKFVLVDILADKNWESEEIRCVGPHELV